MGFIYGLYDGEIILYVGQSRNEKTLKRREAAHRMRYGECGSSFIPDDIEWVLKVLEICDESELLKREAYYIDILKPLYNIKKPSPFIYNKKPVWIKKGFGYVVESNTPSEPLEQVIKSNS